MCGESLEAKILVKIFRSTFRSKMGRYELMNTGFVERELSPRASRRCMRNLSVQTKSHAHTDVCEKSKVFKALRKSEWDT